MGETRDEILTTAEVAKRLKRSVGHVRDLIADGKLRAKIQPDRRTIESGIKQPRRYVLESELNRYIAGLPDYDARAFDALPTPEKRKFRDRSKTAFEREAANCVPYV